MVSIRVFAVLVSLMAGMSAHAQSSVGVWGGQFLNLDLQPSSSQGPRLWLDLHERALSGSFAAIVRPGFGYSLSKNVSVWAGYGWIPTADGNSVSSEHRLWQQVIASGTTGPISLSGRARFEQRFFGESGFGGLRVRGFGRANFKVSDTAGLAFWDEVFVHASRTANTSPGFNQNRLFGGVYLKAPGFRVEVGYLNLVVGSQNPAVSHVFASNVFIPLKVGG